MSNIDEGKEIGRETSLEKNYSAVVLGFKLMNINLYPPTYISGHLAFGYVRFFCLRVILIFLSSSSQPVS